MENIEFYPIPGYAGKYEVSKCGVVRRVNKAPRLDKTDKYFYSKNSISKRTGYVWVSLTKPGEKYRSVRLHQIVARTFIPNPLNKPEINHKNGIKTDNRVENLEWCTHQENIDHANKTGLTRKGERFPTSQLANKSVIKIRELLKEKKHRVVDIARMFNVKPGTIHGIKTNHSYKSIR